MGRSVGVTDASQTTGSGRSPATEGFHDHPAWTTGCGCGWFPEEHAPARMETSAREERNGTRVRIPGA
jgi:hypothetical protein